jgi:cell wall assembly regulator SMI1
MRKRVGRRILRQAAGASDREIRVLEQTLGRALPAGWAQLWRENNGQQTGEADPGLFAGWWFLPTTQIAHAWTEWGDIRKSASPSLLYGACYVSEPPDAVEEIYANEGWIPVSQEPLEGNYVGMDMNPGPAGKIGQVISFGRDEDEKRVLVAGLPELIEWLAKEFEAGHVMVERVKGGAKTRQAQLGVGHESGRLSAALTKAVVRRRRG